ncbi:MAG: hypothetical protein Fur0037_05250 [Planctomycetota bacterium]
MTDSADFREPHLGGGDFLGAFGILERGGRVLMVKNRRRIGGRDEETWDLPGGQVEPGELLAEALAREILEETGIRVGSARFAFVQEGERLARGRRVHAWRSFFFEVGEWEGEPRAGAEIEEALWFDLAELPRILWAPYHDSFRSWLVERREFFGSRWED